jgi:Na+/melibiose symporter-like transporter
VTTEDRELELWKQEWQAEASGSLPQLRKRVRFQTARMIASNLLGLGLAVAVLIYASRVVQRHPDPQTIIRGVTVLLFWIATAIFIVWNQLGIWRVETESTRAYAELSYKRALTKIRKTRFLLILLSFGVTFNFAYLLWEDWPLIGLQPRAFFTHLARKSVVFLAMWLFMKWYGRRKAHQVEQARRFMEELER